jgi:pyruvate/2-oxoglutarate dehydrogenase complex dihydrolipoamide dehydrogenase (E3) component
MALNKPSPRIILHQYGIRALRPKLEGLESVPYLDNASIMELDTIPEHLIVIGGGYIGVSLGSFSDASAAASRLFILANNC